MKNVKLITVVSLLFVFSSCGLGKKKKTEPLLEDEFVENIEMDLEDERTPSSGNEKANELLVLEEEQIDFDDVVNDSGGKVAIKDEEDFVPVDSDEEFIAAQENFEPITKQVTSSGKYLVYTAKRNESLMKIAFDAYSDYNRWKTIARDNPELADLDPSEIVGRSVKLRKPLNPFTPPSGQPYLIIQGDTLSKISLKKYNTMSKWKNIWKHNDTLIKKPDLIFSGMTLYLPDLERSIANF